MNVICAIFGHRPAFGYARKPNEGYFSVKHISCDGMGTHHARLWCDCERCGVNYQVGNIHIPKMYVDALSAQINERVQNA